VLTLHLAPAPRDAFSPAGLAAVEVPPLPGGLPGSLIRFSGQYPFWLLCYLCGQLHSRFPSSSLAVYNPTLAAALVIATANVASAALFLVFDRASGHPGTVVHVHTAGNGACASCPPRMSLYFVAAAVSDAIKAPSDPRLVSVGHLTVDASGSGSAVFRVPDVPNGRYIIMTYCKPCAPYSAGRTMLPLGPFPTPFRVLGSSADGSPSIWPWIAGGLGGLLTVAALVWSLRRRRARSAVVC